MVKHAYGPSRKGSYTLWDLWIDVSFSLGSYKTAGSRLETDEKLGADSYHSTAQTSWGDHQLSHRPASPWFGIFNPPDIIPFHPFHVYLEQLRTLTWLFADEMSEAGEPSHSTPQSPVSLPSCTKDVYISPPARGRARLSCESVIHPMRPSISQVVMYDRVVGCS